MSRETTILENRAAFASASLNSDFEAPPGATRAIFYWNISAVAGTTPIADCKLQYKDPASSTFIDLDSGAFAQKTAAAFQTLELGTEENDSTGDARKAIAAPSGQMRAVFTFDRTTADETYTFTLSVDWF